MVCFQRTHIILLTILIVVLVYRCQGLASNCGFCLELDEKYKCGWCSKGGDSTSDTCQIKEQCNNGTQWLDKQQVCPNPRIIDFEPKAGPYEGGTTITIKGINLGRAFEDIENGVGISYEMNGKPIGFVPCLPLQKHYVKTSVIKCMLQSLPNTTFAYSLIKGWIEVRVQKEYTARSREQYEFVKPKILSIKPGKGPVSGGTLLLIDGLNMNAGSHAEAFLGDLSCRIIRRTINLAECITSASSVEGEVKVRVNFDNCSRQYEYYNYLYSKDPVITTVRSGTDSHGADIRGIVSGGFTVHVRGDNLTIIQAPQMYVEVDKERFYSNCTVLKITEMKCETPAVPEDKLYFPPGLGKEYIELEYGFIMDNVKSVQSLSSRKDRIFPRFRMYQDPEFDEFTEVNRIRYYRSEYLTINVSFDSFVAHSNIIFDRAAI